MKFRLWNKLETFVRREEQLWPDCGRPSSTFPPTPRRPRRFRPKLRQQSTSKNFFRFRTIVSGGCKSPSRFEGGCRGARRVLGGFGRSFPAGSQGVSGGKAPKMQLLSTRPTWPGQRPPHVSPDFMKGTSTGPHVGATDPRAVRGGRTTW